jgi:hypothetical protein
VKYVTIRIQAVSHPTFHRPRLWLILYKEEEVMTKRNVAFLGALILICMTGVSVIEALSAPTSATEVIGTTHLFLPLVMRDAVVCAPPDLESEISNGIENFDLNTVQFSDLTIDTTVGTYDMTFVSATFGSKTHELLDLGNGNYQLNVSVEDIFITYNITCVSGTCLPVTHAWIDIDRIDYQGNFSLGAASECTYFLETYDGESSLTGIDVDTDNMIIDSVMPLYIDQIAESILDQLTIILDDYFFTLIEEAL